MVHLTSLGGLDHEGDAASLLVADEVVVDTTAGNQGRDGDAVSTDSSVRKDNDTVAVADGPARSRSRCGLACSRSRGCPHPCRR